MIKRLLIFLCLVVTGNVAAEPIDPDMACDDLNFTKEQRNLVRMAYAYGSKPDPELENAIGGHIGHTLAALVWRESFVGPYVVPYNTSDGDYGSWGVTHVQFTTYLHMKDLPNTYKSREKHFKWYVDKMMEDDYFALMVAYDYLKEKGIQYGSFYAMRKAYNGGGARADAYAQDMQNRVNVLIRCGL